MHEDDKKVLGGIGGAAGGGVIGGKAGLALAGVLCATPLAPLAPFVFLAGLIGGGTAGAIAGSRNPAAGAVSGLGVIAGIPLPPGGSGGA